MVQALTQMVDITLSIQRQIDPVNADDIVMAMAEEPACYVRDLISKKEEEIRQGHRFGLDEFTEFLGQICDYYNNALILPYVADYDHVVQFAAQHFLILTKDSPDCHTYPIGVYKVKNYFKRKTPMVMVVRERRVVIIISYQKCIAPRLYQIHNKSYLYIGEHTVYVFSVRNGEGNMYYSEFSRGGTHYATFESKRHTYLLSKYYCITSNRHRQTTQDAYHLASLHKEGDDIPLRVYDGYIDRLDLNHRLPDDQKEMEDDDREAMIEDDDREAMIEDDDREAVIEDDDREAVIEDDDREAVIED